MNLDNLIEEGTETFFYYNPVTATQRGYHKFDYKLARYDDLNMNSQVTFLKTYLQKLKEFNYETLTVNEKVDYKIFYSFLNTQLRSIDDIQIHKKLPWIYIYSFLNGIYLLMIRDYLPLNERLINIKNRLQEAERVLNEGENNIIDPPLTYINIAREIGVNGLEFLQTSILPFYEGHILKPEVELLVKKTTNSLKNYLSFLNMLPGRTDDFAVGLDIFKRILLEDHYIYQTPEELLNWGQTILNETLIKLELLAKEIHPNKSLIDVLATLNEFAHVADNLLETYILETNRARDFVISNNIIDFPLYDSLLIEETPLFLRSVTPFTNYLFPPPLQSRQKGRLWITPTKEKDINVHNNYKIPFTVIHEAYPGRHLQMNLSNEHSSFIRKVNHSSLLTNGWAYYCEGLMENLGYFTDPYHKLVRLKSQLLKASSLIVDIKMHIFGMSPVDAKKFLMEKAYLDQSEAEVEVKRNTFNPTLPLTYLAGKREILNLKNDFKIMKADKFDLKDFHNRLLFLGTLPPALARKEIFF